jgi:hypothetical protein
MIINHQLLYEYDEIKRLHPWAHYTIYNDYNK